MSWFYERNSIASSLNGNLKVTKWFGKTAVIGGGVFQSGRYMQGVFRGMLKMLPRWLAPRTILVVGLGAGGCIPVIQRRFPGVHIVALEYDEIMIELAKQTYLQVAEVGGVEILHGDMRESLLLLNKEFDLILVDVFCGRKVAPALTQPEVLAGLSRLLSWQGYLLVNLFEEADTLSPMMVHFFSLHQRKRVSFNVVCLYRHYGMGRLGEGIPAGFQDHGYSRTYLETITPMNSHHAVIEHDGMLGVRMNFAEFSFEDFVHEREPDLRPTDKIRVITWQPTRGNRFPGWWRIPRIFTTHFQKGVAILNDSEYWSQWSNHAKRHRKKFLISTQYRIEEVDLKTFAAAYHFSRALDPLTRRSFVRVLRHHLERHPKDVHLRVVRRVSDDLVVAGVATIDYMDISQSDHIIAFIHPDAQETSVGVGLIDDWFARCLGQGIKFLQFGILHRPGDPRSWKGYSAFKRQFHLYEIAYPRPVWRIVWRESRPSFQNTPL